MNPFTLPQRLTRFQVEITTGCNLACAGCPRTIGIEEGHWTNRHMSVKRFASVIANAPPSDVLVLQGIGEPTLHPRLPEMLQMARADGRFKLISFNTNALFRELDYYIELRKAGLNHVSVSVDSLTPATAEATRSGTDVNQLRAAVRYLIKLFGPGTTLSIVLSKMNFAEMPALLTELHGLGARLVEMQPLIAYAPALEKVRLTGTEIAEAKRVTAELEAKLPGLHVIHAPAMTPMDRRCTRPMHAGYVTAEGFLTPCCTTEDTALFGRANLSEHPFAELWHRPKVAQWYGRFFDHDDAICVGCAFNPQGLAGAKAHSPEAATLAGRAETAGALQRQGRLDEAAAQFRAVLDEAGSIPALQGLGESALQRGEYPAAIRLLEAVQQLSPSARTAHNLAWGLHGAGRRDEAVTLMHKTVTEHADYSPAYFSLTRMLAERGDKASAAGALLVLIRKALTARNKPVVDSAVMQLLALDVDHPQSVEVANLLRVNNRADHAIKLLDAVQKRAPSHLGAALVRCMARLPVIYDSDAEIETCRGLYTTELNALATATKSADAATLAAGYEQVGQAKPFYLSYQGRDDTSLQQTYGEVVSRMVQSRFSALPAPAPRPGPREKIRVGFASNYFFVHSVSKLFRGWIDKLDRDRFEVFVYNLFAGEADPWAAATAASASKTHHKLPNTDEWVKAIAGDGLHALIFPEIGMETNALRLAALRLARVQCMTWGHPVTSGLPTMDYFLSSDLMEPENGDTHYREKLVRMPNLSVYYEPLPMNTGTMTRQSFGLRADAVVYVSCQALYKYLPVEDQVFPAIAAQVPNAQFLFIADGNPATADAFKMRLAKAFSAAGQSFEQHVVFTPQVAPQEFPALLRAGDIYLDSIGWSGGNTTLEAATAGLPIVTLPGALMRSRHTAGILRRMGLDRYIAKDRAGYVALAATLGKDAKARTEAAAAVAANRERLFRDMDSVRALEAFLRQAVDAAA